LTGDNVVESLGGMPWYEGQTILQHLEALEPADVYEKRKSTFSSTNRYSTKTEEYHDFRGMLENYTNNIKVGDAITVLQQNRKYQYTLLTNNLRKLR
jgi:sulfate adenylyltransferase subunit 1